jgi:hypothetical protein
VLVIRKEQMEALRESAQRTFEAEMAAHLRAFSPPLCRTLSEDELRHVIQFGIARAGAHRFTFRGPVRLYLESMLLFGSYFDTDAQYPWAARILADADSPQMTRAEALYDKILDYRKAVTGTDDEYTLAALRRIRQFAARDQLWFSEPELAPALIAELDHIYPQKAAYTGTAVLEALIRSGVATAQRHELTTAHDRTVIVVLMLAFGHGCTNDPLYPWIARTLRNDRIAGPAERAQRLKNKAVTWLDHVLAYFDQAVT